MSVDLKVNFCEISFKNPIIVPAGVHGRDGETIREISKTGVAAICTKTIVSQPATDVLPCFYSVRAGMLNSVFGSDKSSEYWFTQGIKEAKEGESLVIANVAGFTPEESAELALKAEKAGADMIVLPTCCPHMGEILNAMFEGLSFPEPKLTDLKPMKKSVKLMKESLKIPVVVKLSGTFSHIAREWALGVEEAGADGIACSDALGPALSIDIRTGQPVLGGPRGVGGLTGPAIMPITLRMVLDAALATDLPIIGIGGVTTAEDVVEYLMAGSTLVGVCTAGHKEGPGRYAKIIRDLEKLMADLGYENPLQARALTIRRIQERKEKKLTAVTDPVIPEIVEDDCNSCGRCVKVCAYDAVRIPEKAVIDPYKCIGCGLCVSVCPTRAMIQMYY
ncbi:MAG: hypothetical protein DRP87_15800 [Spirochaetes bacterium]|nr:MAG: hypothetical protein DRP87_15800 [Spirochaetota bacterium]